MDKLTEETANKIFDLFINKRKDRNITVVSILKQYATKVSREKWINKIPDINGLYWLYGKLWSDESPKLYIVKVLKVSNGYMWECRGNFLSPSDIEGKFYTSKLNEPELPI